MEQAGPSTPSSEQPLPPSKVIHVHSESDLQPKDIISFLSHYGTVSYVFNMKASNQMLVEMDSIESAEKIVDYYSTHGPPLMNGARVYFQYSKSQSINRDTTLTGGLLSFFCFYRTLTFLSLDAASLPPSRILLIIVVFRTAILIKESLYIVFKASFNILVIIPIVCLLFVGNQSIQIITRMERIHPQLRWHLTVCPATILPLTFTTGPNR